jgi:hypothetical protein
VAYGVGPEFKPQYCKTNKQTNKKNQVPWPTSIGMVMGL